MAGWTAAGSIKGDQGDQGTNGVDGVVGAKWLMHSGIPDAGDGAVGDFAIDTATGDVYEKKPA